MANYKRIYIPGSMVFFTVVTYKRQPFLTSQKARRCLRTSWQSVCREYPFKVVALILLPDHIHCIWQMPEKDADFSKRWGLIRKGFTQVFQDFLCPNLNITKSRVKRREGAVWQRRFWDHVIRDDKDFENHLNYIHYNAVKHGLVNNPRDWPWSTFHQFVKMGYYELDWACGEDMFGEVEGFGE